MANFREYSQSQDRHLDALSERHAFLSRQIEDEQKNPSASHMLLRRLKAQKLKLKDEIEAQRTIAT